MKVLSLLFLFNLALTATSKADAFGDCKAGLSTIYAGWNDAQLNEACLDAHPDCVTTLAKRHHGQGNWDSPWHYRTACRGDYSNCAGKMALSKTRFEWPEALRDLCSVCGYEAARGWEDEFPEYSVSEIVNLCREYP